MKLTCVHVVVKENCIDDFIVATRANHAGTRQEPGNLRFDVIQSEQDPTRFVLYEVFESAAAAAAHKETDHYLTWRETVADYMEFPREGVPYKVICPSDPDAW